MADAARQFATPVSLLDRLRSPGATTAWDRFVELYTPLLFDWARRLGLQDSDGADLVQDVFLILWRTLPAFDYDAGMSFHAWLKTVFLNRHRSRQRQRGEFAGQANEDAVTDSFEKQFDDAEYARYLTRQAFRLIEQEFPTLYQQAFRAYVLEEREPEDIARELGISPGSVYSIKSKVLSRLRQELRILVD